MHRTNLFYPLTPNVVWCDISPYNITPESHSKVTRIKEEVLDC